jgi:hypothetical protein
MRGFFLLNYRLKAPYGFKSIIWVAYQAKILNFARKQILYIIIL